MSVHFHFLIFLAELGPFAMDLGDICFSPSLKWHDCNFRLLNGLVQIFASQDCLQSSNLRALGKLLGSDRCVTQEMGSHPHSEWWAKQTKEGRCSCQEDQPLASSSLAEPPHALEWRIATCLGESLAFWGPRCSFYTPFKIWAENRIWLPTIITPISLWSLSCFPGVFLAFS